jgi:hypothetical protein
MPLSTTGLNDVGAATLVTAIPTSVTISGMTEIISVTVRRTNSTQIEAKKSNGDIAAIAYGGEKFEFEAEGYTTATEVAELAGATWTAFGLTGRLMSTEVVASNEDFVKVRVSGIGIPINA